LHPSFFDQLPSDISQVLFGFFAVLFLFLFLFLFSVITLMIVIKSKIVHSRGKQDHFFLIF